MWILILRGQRMISFCGNQHTFEQVDTYCDIIADRTTSFKPQLIVAVERGGWYLGLRISQKLKVPLISVRAKRELQLESLYARFSGPFHIVARIAHGVQFLTTRPTISDVDRQTLKSIRNTRILLVDDVVQSGKTFALVQKYIGESNVVHTAVISNVYAQFVDVSLLYGIHSYPWSTNASDHQRFLELYANARK